MAVWLVRAGSEGGFENLALENKVVLIGWSLAGDLTTISSREQLRDKLFEVAPEQKSGAIKNWAGQVWAFRNSIQKGDLVALPLKSRPSIAFGKVTGDYQFIPSAPWDAQNQRAVEWITEIPRSSIPQDIRFSLGAFMTVCRIWRNDAENRLQALLKGGAAPITFAESDGLDEGETVDLESVVLDQIRSLVYARFKGHDLARLVAAILRAQGYQTVVSPAGPDGGVDVVAGTGPLGFEPPRLVVQVKSEQNPIDVKVVRELQGVMKAFGADHGLVVAWGGFKSTAIKENSRQHFEIRLWSSDDLIKTMLTLYDRLDESIRAEIPLKRIWTPVLEHD